jgi:hypothetical protein
MNGQPIGQLKDHDLTLGTPIAGWRSESEVGSALGVRGEGTHSPSTTQFSAFF